MLRLALAAAICLLTLPAVAQRPTAIVFFSEWSGALDTAATAVIAHAAADAKATPKARIVVSGFADSLGSARADLFLTQLRAQRVIDALVADGVPARRVKMVAAGRQAEPGIASRRVEIAILD